MRRHTVVSHIAHAASVEAPRRVPAGAAWWDALDPDFADADEGFDLGLVDRLRVGATAAVDVAIRTSASAALAALAVPLGYHPLALRRALDDRALYEGVVRGGDPSRFFRPPAAPALMRVRRATPKLFRPPDGIVESLKFESHFEPLNPRLRAGYVSHDANRFAHVRYWRHRNGPRPTVVAIHGFGAESYSLNQWFLALPWLYDRLGLDVALFNLPFHGRRQTRHSPFSGHGFFAGGPSRINEAFAQAVHDFRLLVDYLTGDRGVTRVGVTGVSLGGYTSALLAATEPRLAFAIPIVPVASLADLILEWQPLGLVLRAAMRAMKTDIHTFRRMLSVASPLTWRPVLPRQRLMVVGGVGDRMASPKHSRLLWDHWDRCRLHWFPGSHILHLDRGSYLREIARFLDEIGFVER